MARDTVGMLGMALGIVALINSAIYIAGRYLLITIRYLGHYFWVPIVIGSLGLALSLHAVFTRRSRFGIVGMTCSIVAILLPFIALRLPYPSPPLP